jgi:hypothetical protein
MKSPPKKWSTPSPPPTMQQPTLQESLPQSQPTPIQAQLTSTTPNIPHPSDLRFIQIQEAFLKEHQLNEQFSERIGHLEGTPDRIVANVDWVLEIITQNFTTNLHDMKTLWYVTLRTTLTSKVKQQLRGKGNNVFLSCHYYSK